MSLILCKPQLVFTLVLTPFFVIARNEETNAPPLPARNATALSSLRGTKWRSNLLFAYGWDCRATARNDDSWASSVKGRCSASLRVHKTSGINKPAPVFGTECRRGFLKNTSLARNAHTSLSHERNKATNTTPHHHPRGSPPYRHLRGTKWRSNLLSAPPPSLRGMKWRSNLCWFFLLFSFFDANLSWAILVESILHRRDWVGWFSLLQL